MSGEGWREPEASSAAGRQGGPRDADPYVPPSETTAGTVPPPSDYPDARGYRDAQVPEASSYPTANPFGIPPSYGMPAVPPQPSAYAPVSYPPAAAPPYGYPAYGYGYASAPQRTSGMAVASLVLGLVWLYWLGSILAVIFGHLALAETKRDPRVGGRGLAIAGLVLGYIGLGILLLGMLAFAAGP